MSKILSVDASTEAMSVALLNGDEITETYKLAPREHAKLLLPSIEALLADSQLSLNQLDAIACNLGPGAFTGIRIGVSVAQGLAYGANLPAIGLSTLENMAFVGAHEKSRFDNDTWLCAIDARMNEVYFAAYTVASKDTLACIYEPCVIAPDQIDWESLSGRTKLNEAHLIGTGWDAYHQELFNAEDNLNPNHQTESKFPRAAKGLFQARIKLEQGAFGKPEELQPIYLRNKVADKKKD